jgi:hypothetical protein
VSGYQVLIDPRSGTEQAAIALLCARLGEALEAIRRTDSRRAARIRQDVRRFALMQPPTGGVGEYSPTLEAIIIRPAFLLERPIMSVALLIVHEATHARLRRKGLRYLPGVKNRHERRCVREEISFAGRLGDPQEREERLTWLAEKLRLWDK